MTSLKHLFLFSKKQIINLFLFVALPIHIWSIIIQFREISGRDFEHLLGRAGYALFFALLESLILWVILLLLSLLLPRRWPQDKRYLVTTMLYLLLAVVASLNQLYFILDKSEGTFWFRGFGYVSRHQPSFFILCMLSLLAVVLFIVFVLPRLSWLARGLLKGIENLVVLSWFYLALDLVGIIVIAVRNLREIL